jgi:hypothetical protein
VTSLLDDGDRSQAERAARLAASASVVMGVRCMDDGLTLMRKAGNG